jgi:hypothetical protein
MSWLSHQWFTYWWSSDKGNGPEAITEMVGVAFFGSLLIPRVRRWWKRHIEDLKAHAVGENKLLHEKLDHIIKNHPDIPTFVRRDETGKFTKKP